MPLRIKPTAAIMRARSIEPLLKYDRMRMPTSIMQKYSGGPNLSATPARGGPTKARALGRACGAIWR